LRDLRYLPFFREFLRNGSSFRCDDLRKSERILRQFQLGRNSFKRMRLKWANDISTFLRSLREIAYCWVCDRMRAISREVS
jgi:hypothetical protein